MSKTIIPNINFHDIPDVLVCHIFSFISDTRTHNAISLVCTRWHLLERSTRTSLTLRGNVRDLYRLPMSFKSITNLDLSLLSPYGYPILDDSSPSAILVAKLIHLAFPSIACLTVYARNPTILRLLAPQWPGLRRVKLVRWHQRSNIDMPLGYDFHALFEHCSSIESLDLGDFYCWTEDLPAALEAYPLVASSLIHLNILNQTSAEGFKSNELVAITRLCPNLRELLATCVFDQRLIGCIEDETLLLLAANCPLLSVLHLVDAGCFAGSRGNSDDQGYAPEDAKISHTVLSDFFLRLPLLEDLVLDVCQNVNETWPAFETLNSKCEKIRSLKLGYFHGIHRGIDAQPDGVAICSRLESLSIKNSADLTDSSLISIGVGCLRLQKFKVHGCNRITELGISTFASLLRKTLVEISISSCKNLNTASSLHALAPIQDQIQRLCLDCVWDDVRNSEGESTSSEHSLLDKRKGIWQETSTSKKSKYYANGYSSWKKLRSLSLWIVVGELLTPLAFSGLEDCPALEEIHIKVEGDCRRQPRPSRNTFGLCSLARYPNLSKMHLDCGDTVGFSLTVPLGYVDLSFWERFYLIGIGNLNLTEVDYWCPQDPDVNQRSMSLPAAGLLAECRKLRKLFIHGTANEHFMQFLLHIPTLRDVQLREDYYPAPENDTSTEMRIHSCLRFEDALNNRRIPD